jgi:hypothetical protein
MMKGEHCAVCGKPWSKHGGISLTCATLENLRRHAVNCREAQRNYIRQSCKTPTEVLAASEAKRVAEELLDKLLEELKP